MVMATVAAEMMLRCVTGATLSFHDGDIERRPYHRNCGCALHHLKGICFEACSKPRNISFPKKKSRTDFSLSMATASNFSSQASVPKDETLQFENGRTQLCHCHSKIDVCGRQDVVDRQRIEKVRN